MKATPPAEREFGDDAPLPSRPVTGKHVAELYELHDEVAAAADELKPWSGGARRRLRAAKVAETDLLRALGFRDWAAFENHMRQHSDLYAAGGHDSRSVDIDLVAEHATDELGGFGEPAPSVGFGDAEQLAGLLAQTRTEVVALHESVAELNEQLERVLLETVALRLELMVAQRHRIVGIEDRSGEGPS